MNNRLCTTVFLCVCVCLLTEQFLSDGDISMDIGVMAAPVITANYIESYHKVNNTQPYQYSSSV